MPWFGREYFYNYNSIMQKKLEVKIRLKKKTRRIITIEKENKGVRFRKLV